MENEIWKDIPGYEGLYQVSNMGRVKSTHFTNSRILKLGRHTKGYHQIQLNKDKSFKTYVVHRLVMLAFKGESDLFVNHINEIRTDNRLENLEYLTNGDNLREYHKNHGKYMLGVYKLKNNKKNPYRAQFQIKGFEKNLGCFPTELEAHQAYMKALEEYRCAVG